MTVVDDFKAIYRVEGIRIVGEILKKAPGNLLRRTGIDGLFLTVSLNSKCTHSTLINAPFQSLTNSLNQLHDESTPSLIRSAVPTIVTLVTLTTTRGSSDYFDKLCSLLGESIIGTIWLYAYDNESVILATVDVLPPLIQALGIGCTRYLKVTVVSSELIILIQFH
jgi:hypothetical protein